MADQQGRPLLGKSRPMEKHGQTNRQQFAGSTLGFHGLASVMLRSSSWETRTVWRDQTNFITDNLVSEIVSILLMEMHIGTGRGAKRRSTQRWARWTTQR
jgi:hypothetical protein